MQYIPHPSLQALLDGAGVTVDQVNLGVSTDPLPPGRRNTLLLVGDGELQLEWSVPSLRGLCRGNRVPPDMMKDYPDAYIPAFHFIEQHVRSFLHFPRQPTDREFEEAYANLRRRPDGRSLGHTHDALWQVAAFTLGNIEMSEAEITAVLGKLGRSAGGWATGPSSRNYLAQLESMFQRGDDEEG
jgi:hypothetical protein